MKNRILRITGLITSIVLLIIFSLHRAGIEHRLQTCRIGISIRTLLSYNEMNPQKRSLEKFIFDLRRSGLTDLFRIPLTIREMEEAGLAQRRTVDKELTEIVLDRSVWAPEIVSPPPISVRTNGNKVTALFHTDPVRLANRSAGYLPFHTGQINMITLKRRYTHSEIDGYLVDNKLLLYSRLERKEYKKALHDPDRTERVFEPYAHLLEENRIIQQCIRAFRERKAGIIILPFFGPLLEERSSFDLTFLIREIHKGLSATPVPTGFILPDNLIPVLLWALVLMVMLVLTGETLFSLLLAAPVLFYDRANVLPGLYIALFFILLSTTIWRSVLRQIELNRSLSRVFLILIPAVFGGCLILSALGTTPVHLAGLERVIGVRFLLILCMIILIHLNRNFLGIENPNRSVRMSDLTLIGLLILTGLVFLFRSTNTSWTLPYEIEFRDWLENIFFVRPRIRELFIGYPLFTAGLLARKKDKTINGFFGLTLFFGSLAVLSSLNTFLHYHSQFIIALFRTAYGIFGGILLGFVYYGLYRTVKMILPGRKKNSSPES